VNRFDLFDKYGLSLQLWDSGMFDLSYKYVLLQNVSALAREKRETEHVDALIVSYDWLRFRF